MRHTQPFGLFLSIFALSLDFINAYVDVYNAIFSLSLSAFQIWSVRACMRNKEGSFLREAANRSHPELYVSMIVSLSCRYSAG